jgi:thiol-disulfide isomerase/thioredoxin
MSKTIQFTRRRFIGATAMTIAGAQLGQIALARGRGGRGPLSAFADTQTWINSEPLTASQLLGQVVLVDFWTYSCINWRRQLPYVRAWAEHYKDKGFIVVGVHAPEFSFEKNVDNVRWATKDMRIDYPVVLDNDRAIWRTFSNEYWPALYFIDGQGRMRHRVFGEGQYQESELVIQKLLADKGVTALERPVASVEARGTEAAADWNELRSEENYVGYERTENFVSTGGKKLNQRQEYAIPNRLRLNDWALAGGWTMTKEAIALNEPGGKIAYRFHARDLHLVMGSRDAKHPIQFRVTIDGQPPGAAHGSDVDRQGDGTVEQPRLYQLIRQSSPVVDCTFEIEFLDPGVEAFSFTFG